MATLTIPYPCSMGDGYIEIKATRQPIIYCKFNNNIIINLASENERLYTLMYGHDTFYTNTLHFRECVLLSPSPGNPGKPFLSKMILLCYAIRELDYDFMRGLLSNVNCIIIAKSKFEEICFDPDIRKFKDDFQPWPDIYEQPFYVIPNSLIECNYNTSFSQLELKKFMLKLRNHSYSMAQIGIGTENKGYAIAKEFQSIKNSDEIMYPVP